MGSSGLGTILILIQGGMSSEGCSKAMKEGRVNHLLRDEARIVSNARRHNRANVIDPI